MTRAKTEPIKEIYQYNNYRNYLRDFYNIRKMSSNGYSYAQFSVEAGISSPNYLKLVMDAKRKITDKTMQNFINALKLTPGRAKYFEYLVRYNQAETEQERSTYFKKLHFVKKRNHKERNISDYEYEFLSKLHYNAIYEMLLLKDFKPDPHWIVRRLNNTITFEEAQRTLINLLTLGFIKEKNGRMIQSWRKLQTPDEEINFALRTFHKRVIELAVQSIDEEVDRREFRGLTIAINMKRLPWIKERLKQFVKELNAELSDETNPDEVYQLGLQFFALTR